MKSISLVLFVDGASFQKTGAKGSIWAMFSCLLDLPPRLRMCYNNIVTHFIVGASNFDLNEFFFIHMQGLKRISFDIYDICIEPKPIGLIADLPALAKETNMIQYNGYFSCFQCLNPGERKGNSMTFKYSKNTPVRTNEIYKVQVQTARRDGAPFEGVKGPCFLSEILKIPDQILFDYMHTSCIGTLEHVLSLWLNQKFDINQQVNDWYLGKYDIINFNFFFNSLSNCFFY